MKVIFKFFGAVCGLKFNFSRRELIGIWVEKTCLVELASLLGCMAGSFLTAYLGFFPLHVQCIDKLVGSIGGKGGKKALGLEVNIFFFWQP